MPLQIDETATINGCDFVGGMGKQEPAIERRNMSLAERQKRSI
jgi:hypothetical protein